MTETTITEALAALKVLDKRILKKREFIVANTLRQEMVKDPHAKDGGSVQVIARELQAIRDLEEQKVAIRRAIHKANSETEITIGKQTRSIADWLVWRRDVAPGDQNFLRQVSDGINRQRQDMLKKGAQVTTPEQAKPTDIVVNLNEKQLSDDIEELEASLGTLDGQLSLKNATIIVSY